MSERAGVTVETVRRVVTSGSGRAACPPIVLPRRLSRRSIPRPSSPSPATPRFDQPIEIVVTGPGAGATAYGHLQIRTGELAEAVVVIDQRGSGTYADNVEFVVGDASAADRRLGGRLGRRHRAGVRTARPAGLGDAVLRHVAVTLGGDVVRMAATVRF